MKIGVKKNMQVMWMIKALLACYIVTGVLLIVISALVYRLQLKEQIVTACIVSVYAISTFIGGFIAGKIKEKRKFFWGLLIGTIYYLLLILISFGVYRQVTNQNTELFTTFVLCIGGGVLGGMIA